MIKSEFSFIWKKNQKNLGVLIRKKVTSLHQENGIIGSIPSDSQLM